MIIVSAVYVFVAWAKILHFILEYHVLLARSDHIQRFSISISRDFLSYFNRIYFSFRIIFKPSRMARMRTPLWFLPNAWWRRRGIASDAGTIPRRRLVNSAAPPTRAMRTGAVPPSPRRLSSFGPSSRNPPTFFLRYLPSISHWHIGSTLCWSTPIPSLSVSRNNQHAVPTFAFN